MSTAFEDALAVFMPDDWHVTNLSNLEPDWQVICTDDDHIVIATGDSITLALEEARRRIAEGTFNKVAYKPEAHIPAASLLDRLGLAPIKQESAPFRRRI